MIEFIQANASWIVLGALFLLMMRMHGGSGMGCGGGHQHGGEQKEPRPDEEKMTLPQTKVEDKGEKAKEPVAAGNNRHSGGCH